MLVRDLLRTHFNDQDLLKQNIFRLQNQEIKKQVFEITSNNYEGEFGTRWVRYWTEFIEEGKVILLIVFS